MPDLKKAPFLFFTQKKSFFSSHNQGDFVWSSGESEHAQDLSFYLLHELRHIKRYSLQIRNLLTNPDNQTKIGVFKHFWRKKKFTIDLETLAELDAHGQDNWQEGARAVNIMLSDVRRFIAQGHTIGINFREVFLVPEGEDPPSHFRADIDICVSNIEEYKTKTELFSYQFGKRLFDLFKPRVASQDKALPSNLAILYSDNLVFDKWNDYKTPLKEYRYSNSALGSYLHWNYLYNYIRPDSFNPVFAFTFPVSVSDLKQFFSWDPKGMTHELTLVFKGSQYEQEDEKQKLYHDLLTLMKESKCTFMIHVLLITKDNIETNLVNLRPVPTEQSGLFQPLPHGAGYYLSSPQILASIYEANQQLGQYYGDEHFYMRLENQSLRHQKQVKRQPGAYILAGETSKFVRKSKTLPQGQLKSNVRLSVTHQEALTQTQAVNEQVQETHAQNVNQELSHVASLSAQGDFNWDFKINLNGFCEKLKIFAKKILPTITENERILEQSGYITQFYLKNHSRRHFYEKLVHDKGFRLQTASKIYGHAIIQNQQGTFLNVKLPHYSVDNIKEYLVEYLIKYIENRPDGLTEDGRSIKESFLFGRTLYQFDSSVSYGKNYLTNPIFFSTLYYLSQLQSDNKDDNKFQSPLHYSVLLREGELASLDADQRDSLIKHAKGLLQLFQPHSHLIPGELNSIKEQFINLAGFYFPDQCDDLKRLERFVLHFVLNEDHLKILVQILISGHKKGLESFFKLLACLEERSLLNYFYLTHFKYARDVSAVVQLFQNPYNSNFWGLVTVTPPGKPSGDWPVFVKFAHHLSVFAAQHNLYLGSILLYTLEIYWKRLYAKFLSYSGSQEEAQKLLNRLMQQLMNAEGLSIAPLSEVKTFYKGLESVLDEAMAKHTLKEQIDEISGISLLATDAPYACKWSDLKVISPEMDIYSTMINPVTKTYSASKDEVIQVMRHHEVDNPQLRRVLFRYLGTQSLREHIAFYRTLYEKITQTTHDSNRYISELLLAFYVISSTGNEYRRTIDPKIFSLHFNRFLTDHGLGKGLLSIQIDAYIEHFFSQLDDIPTDEENGIQSLWSIWREQGVSAFIIAKTPIPEIFLRKFASKQLGHFLLTQKDSLEKALPALSSDPKIVATLINHWSRELNIPEEHKGLLEIYVKRLFPGLNMNTLLQNITKTAKLLESMSSLFHSNPQSLIYLVLDDLIDTNPNVDAFLCFIELIAVEMRQNHGSNESKIATNFALILSKKPQIYQALPKVKMLLSTLLESLLKNKITDNLELLLNLIEMLLPLDMEEAQHIFSILIQMANNDEGVQFLKAHPDFSVVQLKGLSKFVQKVQPLTLALDVVTWLYEKDTSYDLNKLYCFLEKKPTNEIQCLLKLAQTTCQLTGREFLDELQTLQEKPLNELKKLALIQKLYSINGQEILELLAKPSLDEATKAFARQKYQKNLQRYNYDPKVVKKQIADIRLKSHVTEEDEPLNKDEQECLLRDYQLLMSYMMERPIRISSQGIIKEVTISELNEDEFQSLFKTLKAQLNQGVDRHHNQLLVIALSAEALYRTTNKFPRSTQLLTVLKRVHNPGNLIHEVKTGEGKSIIAALHAALLCSLGLTVDIATENNQLAKIALEQFGPFYQYLGIPLGEQILTAQSAHHEYIVDGINYSTASNLALFRARMSMEQKELPKNPALVSDEIDAALTTTVQFRLAATLDPLSNDSKIWALIYQYVLQFVKEEEIYLKNPCSQEEDVLNLKNYFITKNPGKEFLKVANKISNQMLGVLIESAMIAYDLEKNIDYFVVETTNQASKHYYAAPIIASTKRPDPNVSYSEYVQQLLHTLLNNKNHPPTHPFIIEPNTEALIVISAKNFFDYYRLKDGPIIGLTGTAGARADRAEFYEQQGLVAFSYPTFHPDLSKDLGLVTAFGTDEHHKKMIEWIENHKKQYSDQPILLITPSPQSTDQLRQSLVAKTTWKLQSYHGYEEAGKSEEQVIYMAAQDDLLTIANQSLARGADIEPEHEDGLVAINTCVDLTASELKQIQGRAARNGKRGQFVSIIDAQSIGTVSDSENQLAEAFKTHQLQISLKRQQERLKMRFLEETRYLVINEYVLKLRETADKILTRQLGSDSSLVGHEPFLRTLSSLNKRAEKHYTELLDKHTELGDEEKRQFLAARIEDYQEVLNQWIRENQFGQMQVVEPLVSLDYLNGFSQKLQGTTIAQLSSFADFFHRKWKADGHQQTLQNFEKLDELIVMFDPYFKKKCSFKKALGQALEEKGLINSEEIDAFVVQIQTGINEMLEYAESIPVVGYLVPVETIKKFVADYLNTTKTQILEKKWDQVTLPTIDLSGISTWFSGVSTALTMGSIILGGPIPFIVKRFIVPTVFGWIKNKLKQQYANSDSIVAQILIGLDDIGNDLPEALKAISSLSEEKEIKVGLLLDKFGPLFKNKALLLALSKYLELIERPEYIPLIQAIPEILNPLEIYRDCQPKALLGVDTLMVFLQYASRSELILKTLEHSPYKASLQRITQLDSKFITQISSFSFPDFLNLIKVVSHPNFFALLAKLPPDTTYEQLCQWIEKAPEDLSEVSQQAIKELLDYQSNHERIAEENKKALLNLRTTYNLTMEKLTTGLDKLKPQHMEEIPQELETTSTYWLEHGFKLLALIALTSLMIYSAVFLSLSIALTCLILVGWIAYPYIQQEIATWGTTLTNTEPKESKSLNNPFILLNNNQAEFSCPSESTQVLIESAQEHMSEDDKPSNITGSEQGFFDRKTYKEALSKIQTTNILPSLSDADMPVGEQQLVCIMKI